MFHTNIKYTIKEATKYTTFKSILRLPISLCSIFWGFAAKYPWFMDFNIGYIMNMTVGFKHFEIKFDFIKNIRTTLNNL